MPQALAVLTQKMYLLIFFFFLENYSKFTHLLQSIQTEGGQNIAVAWTANGGS